jgi:hypothetical protein
MYLCPFVATNDYRLYSQGPYHLSDPQSLPIECTRLRTACNVKTNVQFTSPEPHQHRSCWWILQRSLRPQIEPPQGSEFRTAQHNSILKEWTNLRNHPRDTHRSPFKTFSVDNATKCHANHNRIQALYVATCRIVNETKCNSVQN